MYEPSPVASPAALPVTFRVLTSPSRIFGCGSGMSSNVDSGTPKFLAMTSFGVCASQSSMLKVVLKTHDQIRFFLARKQQSDNLPSLIEIGVVKD